MDIFSDWLSKRLLELNKETDLSIFVPYITGIVCGDDDEEDSLVEIIKEIVNDETVKHDSISKEFLNKWNEIHLSNGSIKNDDSLGKGKSLDEQMHRIIIQQNTDAAIISSTNASGNNYNKNIILSQYGDISEDDENDESADVGSMKDRKKKSLFAAVSAPLDELLVRNTNAQLIKDREKGAREQARVDAEARKGKDKEDREKQKIKENERREAEKKRTQKGERKR